MHKGCASTRAPLAPDATRLPAAVPHHACARGVPAPGRPLTPTPHACLPLCPTTHAQGVCQHPGATCPRRHTPACRCAPPRMRKGCASTRASLDPDATRLPAAVPHHACTRGVPAPGRHLPPTPHACLPLCPTTHAQGVCQHPGVP